MDYQSLDEGDDAHVRGCAHGRHVHDCVHVHRSDHDRYDRRGGGPLGVGGGQAAELEAVQLLVEHLKARTRYLLLSDLIHVL